jgi:hypothetical protein
MSGAALLIFLLVVWALTSIPGYVIGQRRRVESPGVAFVPLFGPTIVMLWSTGRSGWMCLIALIPIVGWIWAIWFAIAMPASHDRTRWWAVAFFFLPVLGYYLYAFTLDRAESPTASSYAA